MEKTKELNELDEQQLNVEMAKVLATWPIQAIAMSSSRIACWTIAGLSSSLGFPLPENTHTTWAKRTRFYAQLREKIGEMPGVLSAGISTNATPSSSGWLVPFDILGKSASQAQHAHAEFVSPEYFITLQIPLLRGRIWDQSSSRAMGVATPALPVASSISA
jgi:hypothetical protein